MSTPGKRYIYDDVVGDKPQRPTSPPVQDVDLGAGSYPEVRKRAAEIVGVSNAPTDTDNDVPWAILVALCERIDWLESEIADLRAEVLG